VCQWRGLNSGRWEIFHGLIKKIAIKDSKRGKKKKKKKKAPQLVLPTNSRLFLLYNNKSVGVELLTFGMARNSQCFNKKRKVLVTSVIVSGHFCEVGLILLV
jgi:hypothetical protein